VAPGCAQEQRHALAKASLVDKAARDIRQIVERIRAPRLGEIETRQHEAHTAMSNAEVLPVGGT
jgi:hypothetical protein